MAQGAYGWPPASFAPTRILRCFSHFPSRQSPRSELPAYSGRCRPNALARAEQYFHAPDRYDFPSQSEWRNRVFDPRNHSNRSTPEARRSSPGSASFSVRFTQRVAPKGVGCLVGYRGRRHPFHGGIEIVNLSTGVARKVCTGPSVTPVSVRSFKGGFVLGSRAKRSSFALQNIKRPAPVLPCVHTGGLSAVGSHTLVRRDLV